MMLLLVTLCWILSISGGLVLLFRRRADLMIPLALIFGTLLLFLGGVVNNIRLGYYLSWLLAATFYSVLIYCYRKDKKVWADFKENFFTVGLLVFVILVIYVYFLSAKLGFSCCDEFTHWGPMVRETVNSNRFYLYSGPEVIARHMDYPPFFGLMETLFCLFKGQYGEPICYFGIFVFMFALFMPVFESLSLKKKEDLLKAFALMIGAVFVGLTIHATPFRSDEARVYNSIYTDWSLGLFTAYGLFFVYRNRKWDLFALMAMSLIGTSLFLMKQIGVFFYGIIVIYALLKLFFIDKEYDLKLIIKGVIFLAVIPVIFYLIFSFLVKTNGVSGQFSVSQIRIFDLYDILKGRKGEEWERDVYRLFRDAILNRPLMIYPNEFTYIPYLVMCAISVFVLAKNELNSFFLAGTFLSFGLTYAVVMVILYIFSFGEWEGLMLASFDRYMLTYIYIGNCLLFMLGADLLANVKAYWLLVLMFILYLFADKDDIELLKPKTAVSDCMIYDVLVIEDDNHLYEYTRENLNGLKLHYDYLNLDDVTLEEALDVISNYDHLFVATQNEMMYPAIWEKIGGEAPYWSGNVYDRLDDGSFDSTFNSYIYFVVHYDFGSR